MILYSFILYNYYVLYRFHGTHIQIYTSSYKQKTPIKIKEAPIRLWDRPKYTKKPVKRRVFIVAGAGFEPATSGLW